MPATLRLSAHSLTAIAVILLCVVTSAAEGKPNVAVADLADICPAHPPQKKSCGMFRTGVRHIDPHKAMDPRRFDLKITGDTYVRGECTKSAEFRRESFRIKVLGPQRIRLKRVLVLCRGILCESVFHNCRYKDAQIIENVNAPETLALDLLQRIARRVREGSGLKLSEFGRPIRARGTPFHMVLTFDQRADEASIRSLDVRGNRVRFERYNMPYSLPER